ncbi:MAG: hypothetical protein ACRDZ8_04530, partial [Acidimicrobiales bacterium]
ALEGVITRSSAVSFGTGHNLLTRARAALPAGWRIWLTVAAVVVALVGLVRGGPGASVALAAAGGMAAVLAFAELLTTRRLRRAGALIAHAGMALVLIGIAGS